MVFPDSLLEHFAVGGVQGALAVVEGVLEFPDVFVPIGKGVGALAVDSAVLEFPDVFFPIGKGVGALAMPFIVLPFPDVFFPVGPDVGAEAVMLPTGKHTGFGTWGECLGKGSAWKAQQPDGGKSYENKGCNPLHTGSLAEYVGSGESGWSSTQHPL